jgi:hypothetical protein
MKRTALGEHYVFVGTAALVSSETMKSPSLFDWYFILRAHHQWPVIQAIRYALWLARQESESRRSQLSKKLSKNFILQHARLFRSERAPRQTQTNPVGY